MSKIFTHPTKKHQDFEKRAKNGRISAQDFLDELEFMGLSGFLNEYFEG